MLQTLGLAAAAQKNSALPLGLIWQGQVEGSCPQLGLGFVCPLGEVSAFELHWQRATCDGQTDRHAAR